MYDVSYDYDANGSLTAETRSGADAEVGAYTHDLRNCTTGSQVTRDGTTTTTGYAYTERRGDDGEGGHPGELESDPAIFVFSRGA